MVLEEFIKQVVEQGIIAGGFMFLLWHVVNKQNEGMREIVKVLETMNTSLNTLSQRVEDLERKE